MNNLQNETYFTVANESRKTIKKGSQVLVNYGNYTNNTLMVNYGFCIENNIFDCYK